MRGLEAIAVFFWTLLYGTVRTVGAATRAARETYALGLEEVTRRMRNGSVGLLLVLLMPTAAGAAEPWPTVREFLTLSATQQDQYVRAYMWGAAFAMTKADIGLQGCEASDKTPAQVIGEVRAFSVTAAPQMQTRSVNRLIGDLLFTGCRFERASF